MSLESQVADLVTATTALTDAVNVKKTTLDTSVAAAQTAETGAQTAETNTQALLTQTQVAKDEAVAGLGAADQSLNLVQLAYGIAGAVDLAGQAVKQTDRAASYHTQRGEDVITQATSAAHERTYATVAVTLAKPYPDANYIINRECIAAAPFLGAQGDIQIQSRATNGFVLAITGSATSATIRWSTHYPDAK